jgi:hypothetical protein
MDEKVRVELTDILKIGGRNLCAMPRMVVSMLRERCPDAERAINEIEQALNFGSVKTLLAAVGPVDEAEMAAQLAGESGMSLDRARWVIDSWVLALAAADTAPQVARDWSSWNQLDVSKEVGGGTAARGRPMVCLIVVGLAGAAGGASLGMQSFIGGDVGAAATWHEAVQDLPPWLQGTALLTLGILGGFAGGVFGWIVSGGNWTYDVLGGMTFGRLIICSIGAFMGALIGAFVGIALMDLIGIMLGAMLGALAGAVLGLLMTVGLARFWW